MKNIWILFFFVALSSKAQDDNLANLLIHIGDSVKQATLSPFETYNKTKPFERSYLGYSHPVFMGADRALVGSGRIELFHLVGVYFSLPVELGSALEVNTTVEEIQYTQSIASLQGLTFEESTLLDTNNNYYLTEAGLLIAMNRENPFSKNIFFSVGIISTRNQSFNRYSNNGLLTISEDFVVKSSQTNSYSTDVGFRYVLPYFQAGIGYRTFSIQSGFYFNAGLNIPIKVILDKNSNHQYHWYKWSSGKKLVDPNQWKKLDEDAKNFNRRNF